MTLRLYTYDEFLQYNDCKWINHDIFSNQSLGKGAFGQVYKTHDSIEINGILKETVIKKIALCNSKKSRHCQLVSKNSLIYYYNNNNNNRYDGRGWEVDNNNNNNNNNNKLSLLENNSAPSSPNNNNNDNNNVILIPSFILEIIILKEIKKLYYEKKLYALPYLNRYCLDWKEKNPTVYLEMAELIKLDPKLFLEDGKISENIIALYVLQIMCSLHFLQYYMYFTHYDLHWGNIMLSNNDEPITLSLSETKTITFKNKLLPVINDFGTSIFTSIDGKDIFHYINTTNNAINPTEWTKYNEYFDGLTLIKSLTLLGIELDNNEVLSLDISLIPNIINCFIKEGYQLQNYFHTYTYRPDIDLINKNKDGLFNTREVINNLINKFHNTPIFNANIEYNIKIDLSDCFGIKTNIPQIDYSEISNFPLPNFPYSTEKKYFMDFDPSGEGISNTEVKIEVIREVENRNIFAFSLFIGERFFKNAYRYIFDPTYDIILGYGKEGDDTFYRHYLSSQLYNCLSLIKNTNIHPDSKVATINQWADFGILLLMDDSVLKLPMFLRDPHNNDNPRYYLWKKGTQNNTISDIDRENLKNSCIHALSENKTIEEFFKENNIGTVYDYAIQFLNSNLKKRERSRFGLYRYKLDKQFYKKIDIPGTENIRVELYNSVGMLGSIARFFVLQDPYFDVVLYRDAHSTLPNRNYTYDREWYDTWISKTDKKFWTYHGVFYNPPHFAGLKSNFAATWGVRKMLGKETTIFNKETYNHVFGFRKIDEDLFYNKTSYGVDERLIYRLVKHPEFVDKTYLVGITWSIYLITGQENPRKYKILENYGTGELENVEKGEDTQLRVHKFAEGNLKDARVVFDVGLVENELKEKIKNAGGHVSLPWELKKKNTIAFIRNQAISTALSTEASKLKIKIYTKEEFENFFFNKKEWLCRKYDYILPSYSFYTDLRCIFIYFSKFAADYNHIPYDDLTLATFFDTLEKFLKASLSTSPKTDIEFLAEYALNLQHSLPPRYNMWEYIFHDSYLDNIPFHSFFSKDAQYFINTKTICHINKYLWIGNDFNFDKYFFGDLNVVQNVPEKIILPDNYPISNV